MADDGDSLAGIGNLIGGVGSLVQGFGTAAVDATQAAAYGVAAQYAQTNAAFAGEVGGLQELATARQIQHTQGTAAATAAGNGLQQAGSALSLARSTIQQGALAEGMVGMQTAINVTGFEAQSAADQAEQKAANEAGSNAELGGIFGFLGSGVTGLAKLGIL